VHETRYINRRLYLFFTRDCVSGRGNGRAGFRGVPRRRYGGTDYGNSQGQSGGVHVNLCSAVGPPLERETRDMGVQSDDEGQVMVVTPYEWEFSDFPSCWCG